ncbi:DNA-binding response regulator [Anaerotruncus massiliensis (ex Liu et al. 2021)]|uniref:Stage 0 sporulation protein A homolog n=3 Tax=Anaerotruncus TaxID=244127 RepID=A0A498CLQ4_9FIRM|nr:MULTISPECIES: response regulator transcription factor [Anaerotruncus]MBC3939192.1 response regulator transcription factor [Anaerotruncus massiliensis (ex Togo et al. 2019)]RLL09764.1 DNA-binding response regulator [Anaerotruncus massiliensis (ex Liu et al. 2021)]
MIPMILLVMDEGNPRYTETLRQYRVRLTQRIFDEGWQVATAVGVAQALAQLEAQKISLLVFDTTGYRGDRVAQLKLLRASTDLPVLVVVEGGDEHAELEMLENGADDCLHRPASDPLIIAHVKALLKRVHALPPKELRFDGLRLSLAEHVVELDGKTVALSPREFDLLYYLARNPNLALSRMQILNRAWDSGYAGDERTVDSHIKSLRAKLGWFGKHIITVRGVGYKFLWSAAQERPA